jgi:DNA-binding NarL/FixJ family response regulator
LESCLTPAERAVVHLVVTGRANREIAALRGSTESTVKHQLVSVYRKLGVDSRTRLMALILIGRTA